MKALKLIEQIEDVDENPYHKTRTIIFDRDDMAFIKEARAELEALQQRSCEECVHRSFIDEALTNKVTNGFCIENGFFTKRDFCCNRYEAKEQ